MTILDLDLDALLDSDLDGVENIPDYVTPPAGNYMLRIKDAIIDKVKSKKTPTEETPYLVNTFEVVATLETKEPPVADGSLFTERFQITEEGLKYFKRAARNYLKAEVDGVSVRDILASLKEAPAFNAVISHSSSKGDDGTVYTNLRIRVVGE